MTVSRACWCFFLIIILFLFNYSILCRCWSVIKMKCGNECKVVMACTRFWVVIKLSGSSGKFVCFICVSFGKWPLGWLMGKANVQWAGSSALAGSACLLWQIKDKNHPWIIKSKIWGFFNSWSHCWLLLGQIEVERSKNTQIWIFFLFLVGPVLVLGIAGVTGWVGLAEGIRTSSQSQQCPLVSPETLQELQAACNLCSWLL